MNWPDRAGTMVRWNDSTGGRHPPLIWNDRVQGKNRIHFLGIHVLFLFIEPNRFCCFGFSWGPQGERAASTMNQSDMRGLVPEGTRADSFILRRKRGPSTVVSSAGDAGAYHNGATPIAGIVPAPVEDSTVSVIKERFISPQTLPPEEGDEKKKSVFIRSSAASGAVAVPAASPTGSRPTPGPPRRRPCTAACPCSTNASIVSATDGPPVRPG
jgi:hypothetical protein